jgi:hypothetical protein
MADSQIYQLSARTLALTDVFPTQDVGGTASAGKNTITELKATMLLNNVDNTSDANKPVSTAQAVAIAAAGNVFNVKVSLTSAEILALFTTPKVLVAAPGAGKVIMPLRILINMVYNSATYATNTNLIAGLNTVFQTTLTGALGFSTNQLATYTLITAAGTSTPATSTNVSFTLSAATGNPTAGNSPLDVYLTYTVITL